MMYGVQQLLALMLAPLMIGVIARVKAKVAGRHGRPLLQMYFDLAKLLRKGEVIGTVTGPMFRIGPAVSLASVLCAMLFLPLGGVASPVAFQGDCIMAAYLLGVGRFAMMASSLDTGSPFEGMGTSREAFFSALCEPVLFLCFLTMFGAASSMGSATDLSLTGMFHGAPAFAWVLNRVELLLIPAVLFIILLVENCRIPADDPNTHLELTMIHEVMILDHSGPSLAFILYGSALKLWFFAALLAGLVVPDVPFWTRTGVYLGVVFGIAVAVGIVESVMARLRLIYVPHLICGAGMFAAFALVLTLAR
ncbi:MAG: NADH-quinone oxidoreductase subunit H [Desulfovibrionaceae bacterium]|nr:NADH-quinone oxidoreductase subunit H [Desulfovibrionaceae bacterium]